MSDPTSSQYSLMTLTAFTKLRKRLCTKSVADTFKAIVTAFEHREWVSDIFQFFYSTAIITKNALWEERDRAIADGEKGLDNQDVKYYASDKDARPGCKGKNKFWFGYKLKKPVFSGGMFFICSLSGCGQNVTQVGIDEPGTVMDRGTHTRTKMKSLVFSVNPNALAPKIRQITNLKIANVQVSGTNIEGASTRTIFPDRGVPGEGTTFHYVDFQIIRDAKWVPSEQVELHADFTMDYLPETEDAQQTVNKSFDGTLDLYSEGERRDRCSNSVRSQQFKLGVSNTVFIQVRFVCMRESHDVGGFCSSKSLGTGSFPDAVP